MSESRKARKSQSREVEKLKSQGIRIPFIPPLRICRGLPSSGSTVFLCRFNESGNFTSHVVEKPSIFDQSPTSRRDSLFQPEASPREQANHHKRPSGAAYIC